VGGLERSHGGSRTQDDVVIQVRETVIRTVRDLIGEVDGEEAIDMDTPLMELGLDSLATTQLVRQLSEELGLQLAPTLLFDYPTVDAVIGHLVDQLMGLDETTYTSAKLPRPSSEFNHSKHNITHNKLITERLNQNEPQIPLIISTATFMHGDPIAATALLRTRLTMLVKKNPWLAGTLVEDDAGKLCIRFSANPTDAHIGTLFNPVNSSYPPVINSTMPYAELTRTVNESLSLPQNEPMVGHRKLMALSVVPDANRENTFAVIFAGNHVIMDAYTYYKLLTMLSSDGTVSPLSAHRKPCFPQHRERFAESTIYKIKFAFRLLTQTSKYLSWFRVPPTLGNYIIDAGKIAAAAAGQSVTMSDVITSSFSRVLKSSHVGMAVNLRQLDAFYSHRDAGNYVGLLVIGKGSHEEPQLVRKALSRLPCLDLIEGRDELGFLENINPLFVTNTAFSFFSEVIVDKCEQIIHLPCGGATTYGTRDFIAVYRPNAGQLAVVCSLVTPVSSGVIQSECPVGEKIGTDVGGAVKGNGCDDGGRWYKLMFVYVCTLLGVWHLLCTSNILNR